MKKIIILFLILVSISGCIDEENYKIYSYTDGSNFTLFNDETVYVYLTPHNVGYSGTYRITNSELYLIFPTGMTERLSRNGTAWVDKDGWRWELGIP